MNSLNFDMVVEDNGEGIDANNLKSVGRRFYTTKSVCTPCGVQKVKGEFLASLKISADIKILTKANNGQAFSLHNDGIILSSSDFKYSHGTKVIVKRVFNNFPARRKQFMLNDKEYTKRLISKMQEELLYLTLPFTNLTVTFKDTFNSKLLLNGSPKELYSRFISMSTLAIRTALIPCCFTFDHIKVNAILIDPNKLMKCDHTMKCYVNKIQCSCEFFIKFERRIIELYQSYFKLLKRNCKQQVFCIIDIGCLIDKHSKLQNHIDEIVKGIENNLGLVIESNVKHNDVILEDYKDVSVIVPFKVEYENQIDKKLVVATLISEAKRELKANSLITHTPSSFVKLGKKVEKLYLSELPKGRVIGQFDNKCIIYGTDSEVLIIDQHAAHERVLLEILEERILAYLNNRREVTHKKTFHRLNDKLPDITNIVKATKCNIKIPYDTLLKDDLIRLKDIIEHLWKFRYKIIDDRELIVIQLANVCGLDIAPSHLFDFLAISNKKDYRIHNLPISIQNALKMKACRSAIKFGDTLKRSEMKNIIYMLSKCSLPSICAHGTLINHNS